MGEKRKQIYCFFNLHCSSIIIRYVKLKIVIEFTFILQIKLAPIYYKILYMVKRGRYVEIAGGPLKS